MLPLEAVASVRARYRSLPTSRAVQLERTDDEVILNVGAAKQTSVDVLLCRPTSVPLAKGPSEPVSELRVYADDPDALVALCGSTWRWACRTVAISGDPGWLPRHHGSPIGTVVRGA